MLLTAAFLLAEQRAEQGGRDVVDDEAAATTDAPTTPAVTDASYQVAVASVLSTYAADKDVEVAYDSLIMLRVPPTMQQVHFDLVVAFGKLVAGDKADAEARLAALKAQYSWLPL